MSATAKRLRLADAQAIAERFIGSIGLTCSRVAIAGSIRRGLPTVGDIEVCVIPKVEPCESLDMFGEVINTGQTDRLHERLEQLLEAGTIAKRPRSDGAFMWGPRAKYLTFEGVNVDLFSAVNDWRKESPRSEPERFGLILLIRTGPAAYSHQLVTEKGKVVVVGHFPDGRAITRIGLLPAHLRVQGGWLTSRTSGQRIFTPEERDFYDWAKIAYVEPERRV